MDEETSAKEDAPLDEDVPAGMPRDPWESLADLVSRHALLVGLVFLELVFKVSTSLGFLPQLPIILAFAASAGFLLELAACLVPPRARHAATACVLALLGVGFGVEYFVWRAFKVFYDTKTVLSGARDAAGSFMGQIADLVINPSGLVHVALFLMPVALWLVASHPSEPEVPNRTRLACGAVVAHLVALCLVLPFAGIWHAYTDQYSFQTAVPNFGLATSMAKDASRLLSPADTSFEQDEAVLTLIKGDVLEVEEEPAEVTYAPSALDIDFEALAESADGTWADLDHYVASLEPSAQNEMTGRFRGYNLVFISAEAFSAEAIRQDTTPTLWRLANRGIQFTDYYQFDTAGTTGGECANLFGLLATQGGSSVKMCADHNMWLTMGNLLNREGYAGWAFHNNTYTYYGRDKTHVNLGYSNGYMGYGNGMEQWVAWQWPQSDLEMVQGTFDNLYGTEAPFNVYYMSVSGHSNYDPWDNMMSQKNWEAVEGLPFSDRVKGYLAANVELDRAMEWLVGRLEELGIADRTVIVISADHFPYGLDNDGPLGSLPYLSELYGYDVTTYFERDHNRLIIWSGSLEDEDPIVVDTPTFSLDVLPTLANLFGCAWDSRLLPGRDVFSDAAPLVYDLSYDWRSDLGTYYAGSGQFVANDGAEVPEGYVEATSATVANRISYCNGVLTTDYYRHVFGDPDDVAAVNAAGRERNAEMVADAQAAYERPADAPETTAG